MTRHFQKKLVLVPPYQSLFATADKAKFGFREMARQPPSLSIFAFPPILFCFSS